jgi:Fe2+ or Zn2+ uptake regulation protein
MSSGPGDRYWSTAERKKGRLMAWEDLPPHVVCRTCGSTAHVEPGVGLPRYPSPLRAAGFAVDAVEVTFHGVCPSCQAAARDAPPDSSDAGD